MPDPKKKKKTPQPIEVARGSNKYKVFRKEDKGGRGFGLTGYNPSDQYAMGVGPRVGGPAPSSGGVPMGVAGKKQLKRAIKNIRKNEASKQAKRSARKLY